MKRTYLLGFAAVLAFTLLGGTPSFAKGGGGHGGHGGGHGGHGGRGGHSHASAHHGGFAHHNGSHGNSGGHHFVANHSYAHNHAGWGHGGHGWGFGGHGWGYGGHGWGYGHPGFYGRRYAGWGSGYWGGWGPGYVGTGGVGPSYYYSNTVTDPIFPPVTGTVTRNNVTEVIEPVAVPPAPADPSQIGSLRSVDGSTTDATVPGAAPSVAS